MLEVHDPQRLAEVVVRARREAELGLTPPLPGHNVVRLGFPDRHRLVEDVRHPQKQVFELTLHRVRDRELALCGIRHLAQPVLQRFVARPRELFGKLVLLCLDRLGLMQMPPPRLVESQDVVDGRRLALQLRRALDGVRVLADELERQHRYTSDFMTGKRITSRIDGWSVRSMTRRSTPIPSPPHGGSPYSTARRKSSSIGWASTLPAARIAACASKRARWSIGSVSSVNALAYSRPRMISSNRSTNLGSSSRGRACGEISTG